MNGVSRRARHFVRGAALASAALSLAQLSACARQHAGRAGHDDDNATVPDDETTIDEESVPVPTAGRDGSTPQRPRGDQDASVSEPSISALMTDLFATYHRDGLARCPCQVDIGVYASLDECEAAAARARPRVDDCLDRAIPAELSHSVRAWLRCIVLAAQAHTACIEDSICDEQNNCRVETAACPFPDPLALSSAASQCPHAISTGP
jgi:hypothetical protein